MKRKISTVACSVSLMLIIIAVLVWLFSIKINTDYGYEKPRVKAIIIWVLPEKETKNKEVGERKEKRSIDSRELCNCDCERIPENCEPTCNYVKRI